MSTASFSTPLSPATANATATAAGVGLGYGIAIAVGILVLVSTIMLASYLCVRVKGRSTGHHHHHHHSTSGSSNTTTTTTTTAATAPTTLTLGLDRPTIESFPKFHFGSQVNLQRPITGPCPICLSEYKPGDAIRCVPECDHCFHAGCVDEWLQVSASCPLCRSSPVPSAASTPLATPLSELIPLAVHAR
ncbi:Zinc finger RING/FYVE/PHD-type protein [Dioscorea alata]|uniref:Zinc finger RING/FYVE/PHD-type protein n=1 Tax=Dioscorea alata TaxID=55571 RepID=A0ACB7U3J0_DIOAL|nr:Zinc finger RING/FYVE/PHD-type protein [Dioscorea alata]